MNPGKNPDPTPKRTPEHEQRTTNKDGERKHELEQDKDERNDVKTVLRTTVVSAGQRDSNIQKSKKNHSPENREFFSRQFHFISKNS